MTPPLTRRHFMSIAGAGILAGSVTQEVHAQEDLSQTPKATGDQNIKAILPALTHISTKVADATEDFAEDYFWVDDHTLLFLHLTPREKGIFRAVLVDTTNGRKTLAQPFNAKNSPLLLGQSYGFGAVGSKHWKYDYAPPRVSLSPDRQWLLWPTTFGNPELQWIAATLDGKQHIWKQVAAPKSEMKWVGNDGYWLHDNMEWVELVRKYAKQKYTLPRANIYQLGNRVPVRTVEIEGLNDGLGVGITGEGRVMMYHPDYGASISNAHFSLVSLEKGAVKAERLIVPIPKSSNVWQVTLSPTGEHLVWILNEARGNASTIVIYVSDPDGKAFRALGTAVGVGTGGGNFSIPNTVRWLPDGSRMSFRYNKGIHVMSF